VDYPWVRNLWLSRYAPIIASHTLGERVNIYIRRTCNQSTNVCTVAGVVTSAQVELRTHRLSINKYTKTSEVYYLLSFRKKSIFPLFFCHAYTITATNFINFCLKTLIADIANTDYSWYIKYYTTKIIRRSFIVGDNYIHSQILYYFYDWWLNAFKSVMQIIMKTTIGDL